MPYVPINTNAYTAAYAGAITGMTVTGWITNPDKTNYINETVIAGVFAQAFDTAWNNASTLNNLELAAITTIIESEFRNRGPGPFSNPTFQDPNNWTIAARACVALILESDDYFTGQGISLIGSTRSTQTDWWIDQVKGNDKNLGTASAPLASFTQWLRRFAQTKLDQPYFIHFRNGVNELNATLELGPNGYIVLDFAPGVIQLANGTVLNYVPPNGVNEYAVLTVAGITDLTPYMNRRIRFANGAVTSIGAINPLGGGLNTARIGVPYYLDPYLPGFPFGGALPPTPTDLFVIEQLPLIGSSSITIRQEARGINPLDTNALVLANAQIGDATGPAGLCAFGTPDWTPAALWACDVQAQVVQGNVWAWGCCFHTNGAGVLIASPNDMAPFNMWGCIISDYLISIHMFAYDLLVQGGQIFPQVGRLAFGGQIGIFNSPDDAIVCYGAGLAIECQGAVYGKNNTGYGWNIRSGGITVTYGPKPSIAGSSGQLRIVGTNYLWAAVPVFNGTKGSGFIQNVA